MPKPSKKVVAQQKLKPPIWLWGLIVAGVALIVFVAIQVISNNSTPPPPSLVTGRPALQVDKESLDFGNVTLGQTVEAKFEVTNVGDQPLRFTKRPYVEVIEGC
ncbi:hypothetical protein TFLX_06625 [Thermoflexales bacterium]|nr:hypothetical protein TFLX_06625 [Thermoflexales bacterium]